MSVHGSDNRTAVGSTTTSPYSAIVQVRVDFDGDGDYDSRGTGAMVSPDDVLTAGHMLWDPYYGYAKSIEVTPARSGSATPFGTATGTSWHVPTAYVSSYGSFSSDIGVINLSSSIGNSTGWFALQANSNSGLLRTILTTAGYPGDRSGGTLMYQATGDVDGTSGSTIILYGDTLDTYGGQSGSPLWVTVGGQATIVGVHTFGGAVYNGGTTVTQSYYEMISGWTGGDITITSAAPSPAPTTTPPTGTSGTGALTGSAGSDTLTGGSGSDTVSGLAGTDSVWGHGGDDLIYGNQGSDRLLGGSGADTIFGGQNDGPAGSDGIARNGTETIEGGDGNDLLYGNMGADAVDGDAGDDTLYGGQDNDSLTGGDGADRLFGNLGNDNLTGGAGADILYGAAGNDRLVGRDDADTMFGGDGADVLSGGLGDDLLYGDNAESSLFSGIDTIDGGEGIDTAVYLHARSNYTLAAVGLGGIQINGTEVLYNVEYLRFADGTYAVDSLI